MDASALIEKITWLKFVVYKVVEVPSVDFLLAFTFNVGIKTLPHMILCYNKLLETQKNNNLNAKLLFNKYIQASK